MPTKRVKMKKIRDLYRLKYDAKLTHRQIGRALNISPGTVSYYVQAFSQVFTSDTTVNDLDDQQLAALIEPVAKQLRNPSANYVIPNWNELHLELASKHMTLMLLWEDYAKDNPTQHYSYTQFTRLYKAWRKKKKVTLRMNHKAGEEAFIDFAGTTIPIYCRQTGKITLNAQLFLMTLGYSHYTFAYACRSQKLLDWVDAHRRAFNYFGGVPSILVPDNLKSGVTDSCQFEPEANPTYADMAEHYNTTIIPARPRRPQDKSIVENAVLVASRWIITRLLKQTFYSLNALNNALAELLTALNHKPFQKRTGSRYEQFIQMEKQRLHTLPESDYEFTTLKFQTLSSDYHVCIDGHYYSVPYQFIGEKVLCRVTQSSIEIIHNNERIASHCRSSDKGDKTTNPNHMPKAHQQYNQWTPQVFLDWAQQAGSGVYEIAKLTVDNKKHPVQVSKFHFGLKNLAKRYSHLRLDQACRRALVTKCIRFKSIESILKNGLDKIPYIQLVSPNITLEHSNLRGSVYYSNKTK